MGIGKHLEEELKGKTIAGIKMNDDGESLSFELEGGGKIIVTKGICEHDSLKIVHSQVEVEAA